MVEFAPPDGAEILGTAVTASPLAADAPVTIPVQPGCTHVLLSAEECRIINMNRHLERYLGLEPGG